MKRPRFFAPASAIRDGVARLPDDEIHHLRDVLRVRTGEDVEIFDGEGNSYAGTVEVRDTSLCVVGLVAMPTRSESPIEITLALSLIRSDRFEWALEKATELGVCGIVPIAARRSQVRIPLGRLEGRLERWRKIVRGAAKQSGRSAIPEIQAPCALEDFIRRSGPESERLLLVVPDGKPWRPEPATRRRVIIAVGPEGGWEAGEIRAACEDGWRSVGFGPRTQRSETAAVAALAILQYALGDMAER